MKNFVMLSAAVVLAAMSSNAYAAAPGGARVEAVVGYDKVSDSAYYNGTKVTVSRSGVAYGVAAGYDVPVAEQIALGLDAEVAGSTVKNEFVYYGYTDKITAGRDLYVGARLTFAAADRLNLYVKAGYSNAQLKEAYRSYSDSTNFDGFRTGLGAQFNLTKSAYVLAEYRYSTYKDGFTRDQLVTGLGVRF
ncbi:porin family protein [Novosphingobium umbonatum]|uniref:Porin family protein n=1 Tax=Novosphingobium umbonatum TaxID=1908524 RepID=A0A3S2UU77_9SPHN|nr:porin family protein [Novosphingobium umbonatum]RVU07058.1 porin family protein [Novosphingobium umbonatum]